MNLVYTPLDLLYQQGALPFLLTPQHMLQTTLKQWTLPVVRVAGSALCCTVRRQMYTVSHVHPEDIALLVAQLAVWWARAVAG